jgi:hypothetical protein
MRVPLPLVAVWTAALAWSLYTYFVTMKETSSGEEVAVLAQVRGEVLIREPLLPSWFAVGKGRSLLAGSLIATGKNATAEIRLKNGQAIRLGADSQISLEFMSDRGSALVDIINGRVTSVAPKSILPKAVSGGKLGRLIEGAKGLVANKTETVSVRSGSQVMSLLDAEMTGLVKKIETEAKKEVEQVALRTVTPAASPESTPAATPEATLLPTPEPTAVAVVPEKEVEPLSNWSLRRPTPSTKMWLVDRQKTKAPLDLEFVFSGTGAPPKAAHRLQLSREGKPFRVLAPSLAKEGSLIFKVPPSAILGKDEQKAEIKVRLVSSVPEDSEEPKSEQYNLEVNNLANLDEGPLLLKTAGLDWRKKRMSEWRQTSSSVGVKALEAVVFSKEILKSLLAAGHLRQPFSIEPASMASVEGVHFVSKGEIAFSVRNTDFNSKSIENMSALASSSLVFQGKSVDFLPVAETNELVSGIFPAALQSASEIYVYLNGQNIRFTTALLKKSEGLRRIVGRSAQGLFLRIPKVLWDDERLLSVAGERPIDPVNPALGTRPAAEYSLTFMRVSEKKEVSFPNLGEVGLDRYSFLRPALKAELRLNFLANGFDFSSALKKDLRSVFEALDAYGRVQVLVVMQSSSVGARMTVFSRESSDNIEDRSDFFVGKLSSGWFGTLVGYDGVVSAREGGWATSYAQNACRPSVQSLAFAGNESQVLSPRNSDREPDAVLECVRSQKGLDFYRIVWERNPNVVKAWSRLVLAN